jgi:hypothetical protein
MALLLLSKDSVLEEGLSYAQQQMLLNAYKDLRAALCAGAFQNRTRNNTLMKIFRFVAVSAIIRNLSEGNGALNAPINEDSIEKIIGEHDRLLSEQKVDSETLILFAKQLFPGCLLFRDFYEAVMLESFFQDQPKCFKNPALRGKVSLNEEFDYLIVELEPFNRASDSMAVEIFAIQARMRSYFPDRPPFLFFKMRLSWDVSTIESNIPREMYELRRHLLGVNSRMDKSWQEIVRCNGGDIPLRVTGDVSRRENALASKVIIMMPGRGGDASGFNRKYDKIATHVYSKTGGASVIQMGNPKVIDDEDQAELMCQSLRSVIGYVIQYGQENQMEMEIYLMGFSAGASAIAAVAYEYAQVKEIALIVPSLNVGEDAVRNGLTKFEGKVSVIGAENDDVEGPEMAGNIFAMVRSQDKQMVTIPHCNHGFHGVRNGICLSKIPLWAFFGGDSPINPHGGIILY